MVPVAVARLQSLLAASPNATTATAAAAPNAAAAAAASQPAQHGTEDEAATAAALTARFNSTFGALQGTPARPADAVAAACLALLRAANATAAETGEKAIAALPTFLEQAKQLEATAATLGLGVQRMARRTRVHVHRLCHRQDLSGAAAPAVAPTKAEGAAASLVALLRAPSSASSTAAAEGAIGDSRRAAAAALAAFQAALSAKASPALTLAEDDMAHVFRLAAQAGSVGQTLLDAAIAASTEGRLSFSGAKHEALRQAYRADVGSRASAALALAWCALKADVPAFATLPAATSSVSRALALDELCRLLPACDSPLLAEALVELVYLHRDAGGCENRAGKKTGARANVKFVRGV